MREEKRRVPESLIDTERHARATIISSLNVPRGTIDALDEYAALLQHWSPRINLVSKGDLKRLWSRHVTDSLGLFNELPELGLICDLGSGAGFPGIPLAIVSRGTIQGRAWRFIESDQRKAVFLREVVRRFDLNAEVVAKRIEEVEPMRADVVVARALAPLPKLLDYVSQHCADRGRGILLKGETWDAELTDAAKSWHIRYQAKRHPLTLMGYILIIEELRRAKHS